MRVIAGRYKGHRLFTPKGKEIRPSTDRTREFLFSYLGDSIKDAYLLDLFAGSGSVGLEALSRNAAKVIFVDKSPRSCELIQKNLQKLGEVSPVYFKSEKSFIIQAIKQQLQFNFIFCDPPYNYQHFSELLQQIKEGALLREKGLVIYESSTRKKTVYHSEYKIVKEKNLGDTKIIIYKISNQYPDDS